VNNKKLSYTAERHAARQRRTFFWARSMIVHFTEHQHFTCYSVIQLY